MSVPLMAMIESVRPGPCPGCPAAHYCATYHLACEPFLSFVLGRNAKRQPRSIPIRHNYLRAFYVDEDQRLDRARAAADLAGVPEPPEWLPLKLTQVLGLRRLRVVQDDEEGV